MKELFKVILGIPGNTYRLAVTPNDSALINLSTNDLYTAFCKNNKPIHIELIIILFI